MGRSQRGPQFEQQVLVDMVLKTAVDLDLPITLVEVELMVKTVVEVEDFG